MDSSNFQLDNEQSYVGLIDDIDAHSLISCNEVEDIGTDNIEDYPTEVDNDVMRDNINDVLDVGVEEESNIIPHVGKMFRNESEAYSYYNAFARHKGFSIRKSTFRKKGDDVIWRVFVCSKEGYKDENDKRREGKDYKRRRVTREGCKARMKISKTKEDLWKVTFIDDEHNHPMLSTPSKVARLRSHNKAHLTPHFCNLVEQLEEAGVGPADSARVMMATGASSSAQVMPQQCIDIRRKKRSSNVGRECQAIIQHFMKRKLDECQFYFAMEMDEDNTCRSIFWADGRARTSYLKFSDVVVFDVTYKTNSFSLPFAPFTGVNHHFQSTLFGCALLADEREETFVWLFQTWLHCMWDKMPGAVITDQDLAIRNAIRRVFPNTRHRYCVWHIGLHEGENLKSLMHAYPNFDEDYKRWAYFSKTISESEAYWNDLKNKYKHEFNEPLTEKQRNQTKAWNWLESMYEQRQNWVEAYFKDIFLAGMRSSQRSESINAFFDTYVNSMTPLSEFVNRYEQALASRRAKEDSEDTLYLRSTLDTQGMHVLEIYASKIYTSNVFRIFQDQFKKTIFCEHETVQVDGCIKTYKVMSTVNNVTSNWLVECNKLENKCSCMCAMFEMKGILCKHILYIMKTKLKLKTIPERYILTRWTMKARHSTSLSQVESNMNSMETNEITPIEAWSFQALWMDSCAKAIRDRELFDFAKGLLDSFEKKSASIEEARAVRDQVPQIGSNNVTNLPENIMIQDPRKRVGKGRPKTATRIFSGIQTSQNTRTCSKCNKKGHDRRTCTENMVLKTSEGLEGSENIL